MSQGFTKPITLPQGLGTTDSPTFADITDSGLTASQPVKTDAAKKLVSGFIAGEIVQVVNYQTGAVATGATPMVLDDTIPQKTEGNEFMTLAITPKNANNILVIIATSFGCFSATPASMGIALFKDAVADALAAMARRAFGADSPEDIILKHYMVAGTTSEITFKVRIGGDSAGTFTFNGQSAGRWFGGVMASGITIWEIAV